MSAHSSPFMLDDLHFAPPSPVLTNSCFNDFDLFDCPVYPASRPSSRPASPCRAPPPRSDKSHASGSCSTRTIGSFTATIARRSVHLGGKQLSPQPRKTPVNWARPIRLGRDENEQGRLTVTMEELESGVSLRLFGASMQRQRRIGRQSALSQSSSPVPSSPCHDGSRDDREPLTPSTQSEASPVLMTPPSRMQRVTQAGLKGLGVGDLFGDWSPRRQVTIVEDVFTAEGQMTDLCLDRPVSLSSTTSSFSSPSLVRVSALASSQSIVSESHGTLLTNASPSTLEELRELRRAASALEEEAKRPIRVGAAIRKIKRKPVPALLEQSHPIDSSLPRLSTRQTSLPFSIPERQSSMAPRAAGRPTPLDLSSESPRSSSDSGDSPMPSASSSSSNDSQDDCPVTPGNHLNTAQMFQMPSAFASQSYLLHVDAPSEDGLRKDMPPEQLADALQRLQDASPTKSGRRTLSRLASHFSRSVL